jgi:hypothetical protein
MAAKKNATKEKKCQMREGWWKGLPHWTCQACRLDTLEKGVAERAGCPLPVRDDVPAVDDEPTDQE